MKKRILSLLLCIVMVLSLLPAAAFAAEDEAEAPALTLEEAVEETALLPEEVPEEAETTEDAAEAEALPVETPVTATEYYLWVNGERITSDKLTIVCGSGTATYDPQNEELTLWNATITTEDDVAHAGIRSADPLTIIAEGSNTIKGTHYGIYASENLTLCGSGSMRIESQGTGIDVALHGVLLDNGGDVYIEAGNDGICASEYITLRGSGNVMITSGSIGIYTPGDVAIDSSGDLTVTAKHSGINAWDSARFYCSGDVTISAQEYGVSCKYSLSISGSGDLDIYGKKNSISFRGWDNPQVLLEGTNGLIFLRTDSGNKAISRPTSGSDLVAGINYGKYTVIGSPDSEYVAYTLTNGPIRTVAINDLEEPVVGQHPDQAFTVQGANSLGVMGFHRWVEFSSSGVGRNMASTEVFKEGYHYACYISLSAVGSRNFAYATEYDDYGDAYYPYRGIVTVNGTTQTGYTEQDGASMSVVWWLKAPLPANGGNPFVDVHKNDYFFSPVLWALEKGVTNGIDDTHFGPAVSCTRAQVVTFLWRAAGKPEPTSTTNPFKDVKSSDYFYKPVLWAVENGIANGVNSTTFGSSDACTRAQVVTFLWRAKGQPAASGRINFSDVRSSDYFYNAVRWAVENGITNGVDANHFGSADPCTRAQVVTFLYRAYGPQQ